MTERLRLPEALSGAYDHVIICTYGADLAFLEQDLWRKLGRARNRIVLADELQLAETLNDAASAGTLLRHLNANYLAVPVTNPNAAHAKLILLTGPDVGLLLIGSGNLGMNGYASQGELFCQYRYQSDDRSHLGAFQTTREFLDGMAERNYLNPTATTHLAKVWADTPWMYQAAPDGDRPVRHNLHTPLLNQLAAETAGAAVDEVVIHAPFYDRRCQALRRLLERLAPRRVTVLVQQHETSVDPKALDEVLARHHGRVRTAAAPIEGTYLHAKFVLVRQRQRAVLLQGSANLSVAALCRADPRGNLELVNLLRGSHDAFDEVLAGLAIGSTTADPTALGLRYQAGKQPAATAIRLVYGLWDAGQLTLEASCDLPAPDDIQLLIGGEPVAASQVSVEGRRVAMRPDAVGVAALERAVPVALRLTVNAATVDTWPTWPYQQAALRLLLSGRRDPKILAAAGSLGLPDDEVAALLDELDASLVIDGVSLWRVVRHAPPTTSTDGGHGPRTRYEELDWDRLRQHPKLAQYGALDARYGRLEPTDLQVVLTAITDHFRGLSADRAAEPDALDPTVEDTAPMEGMESEQERIEQDQERERRRLSLATRNRMAWRRFVDRFLDGLDDERFVELVGPVVVATNAVIFNHLLALLLAKDQIDEDYGVTAQLWLWEWLWLARANDAAGFFESLDEDERTAALQVLMERHADAMTVAGIYQATLISRHEGWQDERVRLRDLWRILLTSPYLVMTKDVVATAATQAATDPVVLATTLDALARLHTSGEFLAAMAAVIGANKSSLSLGRGRVRRGLREQGVDILTIGHMANTFTAELAAAAFAVWISYEPERDYYRIAHSDSGAVAVYDRVTGDRWWANKNTDEMVDLEEITLAIEPWQAASAALIAATKTASSAA